MQRRAPLDWVEIPVANIARAAAFYGAMLETALRVTELAPGHKAAFLPMADAPASPGCALVEAEGYVPAGYKGCRLYFNALPDMEAFLARVEEAGGHVEMPPAAVESAAATACLAYFFDTEGNLLGAHAPG